MELTFECPRCRTTGSVSAVETEREAKCPSCGESRPLHRESFADGALNACAWCATTDMYVQKDFPHVLGLSILALGFAVSTVFWYFRMPIGAFAVLISTTALDAVLYYLVPDVTTCYRCLSQFRGAGSNPLARYEPFDLAIGERYRQERLRIEELRQKRESSHEMHGS
jgi:hypothetical protein